MRKRYMIPLIILAILILPMVFRWDTQATKSYDTGVCIWKQDRWTGEIWYFNYRPNKATVSPTQYEEAVIGPITTGLTLAWWGLLAANIIWLLVVFMRRGERGVN